MNINARRTVVARASAAWPFLAAGPNAQLAATGFKPKVVLVAAGLVIAIQLASVVSIALFVALTGGARVLAAHEAQVAVVAQVLMNVAVTVFLLKRLPAVAGVPLERLNVRLRVSPAVVLAGVAGGLIVVGVTDGLAMLLQMLHRAGEPDAAIAFIRQVHSPLFVAAITISNVVTTPIAEELFFRGLVFNALYARVPLWSAACISGAFFGIYHLSVVNFVPLTLAGILLALLYARFRNLWASIIAHAVLNATVIAFALA